MAAKTKKCPFCAETIKAEAVVCRYCGRDLVGGKKAERKFPNWLLLLFFLVAFVIGMLLLNNVIELSTKNSPLPTGTPRPEYNCVSSNEVSLREENKRICVIDPKIVTVGNNSTTFYVINVEEMPSSNPFRDLFQRRGCVKVIGTVRADKNGIPFIDLRESGSFELDC